MYQIKLSVDKKHGYWLDFITNKILSKIKQFGGIFALSKKLGRESVCFAVPSKDKWQFKKMLCEVIAQTFIDCQKCEYFNRLLNIGFCDLISKQMLVNALTSFNSKAEKKYILKNLRLTGDFNLDGFYNFKIRDLVSEWHESAGMIMENAEIMRDEQSFNVMLKFLLSGIDARIKVVYLVQEGKFFSLKTSNDVSEKEGLTEAQLLVKLTEIAPEKVVLCNRITNNKLMNKLGEIFCLKDKNCEKI